ncbi:MAG TPA: endonuclease/exonuclease/phosphatase family protein [Luteitalea sp.]|nr:endonuclease/exonuclease/phosphatase family protein [Luteitalea sp.]
MATRRLAALALFGVLLCLGPSHATLDRLIGRRVLAQTATFRVLSWNISSSAVVRDPAAFRAIVTRANPDILLLDEVAPAVTDAQVRAALPEGPLRQPTARVAIGVSGGRQRGVIVSRWPFADVPELSTAVPYPTAARERLRARMRQAGATNPAYSMDGGIPVNGAIATVGERRVLVVILDLQCCGENPASWEEERRRIEVREIRRRIDQVLARTKVDALIVAGDFNLVSTPLPLTLVTGPYPSPIDGLIAADLRHLDGKETWTWDGRGTPFPSRPMDFVLYPPRALALRGGHVLDSADLPAAELARLGIAADTAVRLSSHLPLVSEFTWR